jgi:hypothetical protein
VFVQISDEVEAADVACARERFTVAGIQRDAVLMEIADDVEMAAPASQAERLVTMSVQRNAVFMQIADDSEVAVRAGAAERLLIGRVERNPILMQIANDIEVAVRAGARQRLLIGRVEPDPILMQIADDIEGTALTRCTKQRLVVEAQIGAALVNPTDRGQVTPLGGFTNRSIRRSVFSAPFGIIGRNAAQQSTRNDAPPCGVAVKDYRAALTEIIFIPSRYASAPRRTAIAAEMRLGVCFCKALSAADRRNRRGSATTRNRGIGCLDRPASLYH